MIKSHSRGSTLTVFLWRFSFLNSQKSCWHLRIRCERGLQRQYLHVEVLRPLMRWRREKSDLGARSLKSFLISSDLRFSLSLHCPLSYWSVHRLPNRQVVKKAGKEKAWGERVTEYWNGQLKQCFLEQHEDSLRVTQASSGGGKGKDYYLPVTEARTK